MPTNEQRRQAAKRKLERQIVRRAERVKRRRTVAVSATIATVVAVVVGVYLIATLGGDQPPEPAAADGSQSAEPQPAKTSEGPCAYTSTPEEPAAKPVDLPADPASTPSSGTVKVTFKTSQGDVPVTLDRAKAPCTVQSIEHLVKGKFYDETPCHRLTTAASLKVLQCGDPTGQGSGGPGYTIKDEFPTDLPASPTQGASQYSRGLLAMANTGEAGSGGSQFFLVYADSALPPKYTVFGSIDPAGLATLDKIATAGVDPAPNPNTGQANPEDGAPKAAVTIQQAAVLN